MFTFVDNLQAAMQTKKSVLCVGLDPQLKFMPPHLIESALAKYGQTWEALADVFSAFNAAIINAVEPYAPAVKPQAAFYEASRHMWGVLEHSIDFARFNGLITIKDAKRKDGGDTAEAYAQTHIGEVPFFNGSTKPSLLRTDAVTIDGYIAESCVSHFVKEIKKHGTAAFVVCKTSFEPNSEIENLVTTSGLTVWEELAHRVAKWGEGTEGKNRYRNLGVVMGATYPEDAPKMRAILPKAIMLVPGYGAQGGGADGAVVPFNEDGFGAVVNSSRGIIAAWQKGPFACDPKDFAQAAANAAKAARDDLNEALKRAGKYPF
ncbi:orotidine 5'-phosphate decarboxylase [Candidatus Kaiserbacteria bacterium RIFCSPLOWO2_01_FULL_52_12b]|uniref:Orotidine-5'-phosphate decarboxylase n=1 Tax=Candidatus Kaiserbacteria bacterium RIFCSPLOWO2_01_FULL_52_12b TaxID=1798509 RepID=A0A1F6EXX0_9BACT|nr:MAG: orotidine 5'-phosphate decarboxylase [Candidatus Kaiserbacteria bacterium RIFCSPLOWO2_01_FULL_52_12b]